MEKGMVRCDVNVSIRPRGATTLGAKIEIKNMNSFSGVRRALEYEIQRQMDVLAAGGTLRQETRRWDDVAGITEPMRTKEEAHDYRYFPEPDLMPLAPTAAWMAEVRARLVELPLARKQRFMREYQLPASDAETFKNDKPLADYYERLAGQTPHKKTLANWVINNLRAQMSATGTGLEQLRFTPAALLKLVDLVETGKLSSKAAQEVFGEMFQTGQDPAHIMEQKGLVQVSDAAAIEALCDQAIAENPRAVADYRAGKAAALNALKGCVMKLSKGKANPAVAGEILERKLKAQ
jgi:aspartyl-tRNA(Asn)/glutamyl-tRNA(Gln) amidotransferase subunit B